MGHPVPVNTWSGCQLKLILSSERKASSCGNRAQIQRVRRIRFSAQCWVRTLVVFGGLLGSNPRVITLASSIMGLRIAHMYTNPGKCRISPEETSSIRKDSISTVLSSLSNIKLCQSIRCSQLGICVCICTLIRM